MRSRNETKNRKTVNTSWNHNEECYNCHAKLPAKKKKSNERTSKCYTSFTPNEKCKWWSIVDKCGDHTLYSHRFLSECWPVQIIRIMRCGEWTRPFKCMCRPVDDMLECRLTHAPASARECWANIAAFNPFTFLVAAHIRIEMANMILCK